MSFPIKNGGSFHSYVSLPEGKLYTKFSEMPIWLATSLVEPKPQGKALPAPCQIASQQPEPRPVIGRSTMATGLKVWGAWPIQMYHEVGKKRSRCPTWMESLGCFEVVSLEICPSFCHGHPIWGLGKLEHLSHRPVGKLQPPPARQWSKKDRTEESKVFGPLDQ